MGKGKYAEPVDDGGGKGWTVWVRPIHGIGDRNYRMACCDCHLIHELQFRVRKRVHRGGRLDVEFRVRRNQKATVAHRRGKVRYVVKNGPGNKTTVTRIGGGPTPSGKVVDRVMVSVTTPPLHDGKARSRA